MNTIDLQIQTTFSDGKHSPRECVKMAKDSGLGVIAITDHDTVDGVPEALAAGGEFGVRIIPGIEISVKDRGAHILGFGIDHQDQKVREYSEWAKQSRIEGAQKMVENLKKAGFTVEWEDVLKEATGGVVARPHISRAVLARPENKEKLGGIYTVHEFIEKFLGDESPYAVKRAHISAQGAVDLIHRAGGVAIWSHPAIHFRGSEDGGADYEGLENFLKELIGWGVEGVEVFTPSHTEDDVEFLLGLAEKYKLLKTSGSDFHETGQGKKAVPTLQGVVELRSAENVGDYPTYGFSTEGILEALDEAIKKRRPEGRATARNEFPKAPEAR